MANTSKHISIRIPEEVYAALKQEAKELDRSISWVINVRLGMKRSTGLVLKQNGTVMKPAERLENMDAPLIKPLMELRAAIEERDERPPYIEVTPEQLSAHRKAMQGEPLGSGSLCPDCGGLKGLHQKGCKAKHNR